MCSQIPPLKRNWRSFSSYLLSSSITLFPSFSLASRRTFWNFCLCLSQQKVHTSEYKVDRMKSVPSSSPRSDIQKCLLALFSNVERYGEKEWRKTRVEATAQTLRVEKTLCSSMTAVIRVKFSHTFTRMAPTLHLSPKYSNRWSLEWDRWTTKMN